METTKTRQQSILTFAVKTSPAINMEASTTAVKLLKSSSRAPAIL